MARLLERLTARSAVTLMAPGRHADGGGLFLVVDPSGAKRWVFLFRWKDGGRPGPGRIREMGLGSFMRVIIAAYALTKGHDPATRSVAIGALYGIIKNRLDKDPYKYPCPTEETLRGYINEGLSLLKAPKTEPRDAKAKRRRQNKVKPSS